MTSDVFSHKLLEGEKVIWTGQPGQGVILTGRDALMIPFSLLWSGFVVFWETTVLSLKRSPVIMRLWGIPFVLAGIYFIFGRFLVDAYIRKRMHYAVTNQRILISRLSPFTAFTSLSLDRLPELRLTEGRNGRGTIYFGQQAQGLSRNGFGVWTPSLDSTPQFISIDDAQNVYGKIQRAIRPSSSNYSVQKAAS